MKKISMTEAKSRVGSGERVEVTYLCFDSKYHVEVWEFSDLGELQALIDKLKTYPNRVQQSVIYWGEE